MKTLKTIVLSAGAVALWGASGLCAQTKATAEIPFEFNVQNATLPAGAYAISPASASHALIMIRNVKTRKAVVVLAPDNETEYKGAPDQNVVLFHRIDNRYFLAEVKTDFVRGHVGASKQERELASQGNQPVAAVIIPALSVR